MKHSRGYALGSIVVADPVVSLSRALTKLADPERAFAMSAYMRDQFAFLGVPTPERRKVCFEVVHASDLTMLFDEADALFRKKEREYHYCACDVLAKVVGRRPSVVIDQALKRCETLITTNSWWDTVDTLAPKVAGGILRGHAAEIQRWTKRWIESNDIWLQRSAIILQLHYKTDTDLSVLFDRILRRADSKEFFVQKGAGWALREHSKIDPKAIRAFINANPHLSALTKREGGKYC
ncbi:MAG: DNA alkylation repair protein [Candidatus Kapabacteria bacterium]|nr:DNA alkylation repair protein [Candidatus Kapabacteria bacterium]